MILIDFKIKVIMAVQFTIDKKKTENWAS